MLAVCGSEQARPSLIHTQPVDVGCALVLSVKTLWRDAVHPVLEAQFISVLLDPWVALGHSSRPRSSVVTTVFDIISLCVYARRVAARQEATALFV